MEKMLGGEYPAFLHSYSLPRTQALRINPLKRRSDAEALIRACFPSVRHVPWEKDAFYYDEAERPGRHPLHEAGLYYIQEPSAMLPAVILAAAPGEKILDLCAAPGGKSTQIAAAMRGRGLLVANEIHPARARILSGNIERMGIANALVTNADVAQLAQRFPLYFDAVLVDAPCSGEGMFRKEPETVLQWSEENVARCAARQRRILEQAAGMLKPGGRLVYSTCTFSREENEDTVRAFLDAHPDYEQADLPLRIGKKLDEWGIDPGYDGKSLRIWPHHTEGEGHFAAMLVRRGSAGSAGPSDQQRPDRKKKKDRTDPLLQEAAALWNDFAADFLSGGTGEAKEAEGVLTLFGETLYRLPCDIPLAGLKVERAGLALGSVRKGRFVPDHALALSLAPEDAAAGMELGADAGKYLRGETITVEAVPDSRAGWVLMTADGCSIGWGKNAGGMIKNHYPKGLRIQG